jgi:uncharacterized protein YjgD (DUF1641 family)
VTKQKEVDMQETLTRLEPLLQAIADIQSRPFFAAQRAEIERVLTYYDTMGWQLYDAVQRIWAGEHDAEVLTRGILPSSAVVVRRILEIIEERFYQFDGLHPDQVADTLPAPLREAMKRDDHVAYAKAFAALSPDVQRLVNAAFAYVSRYYGRDFGEK